MAIRQQSDDGFQPDNPENHEYRLTEHGRTLKTIRRSQLERAREAFDADA